MRRTKLKYFFSVLLGGVLLSACGGNDTKEPSKPVEPVKKPEVVAPEKPEGFVAPKAPKAQESYFPKKDDKAKLLPNNPSRQLFELLPLVKEQDALKWGTLKMTQAQYEEISVKAKEIVGTSKSQQEKYEKIYTWVSTNVKYGHPLDNDPYTVLTSLTAVCQGYSNLLKAMLISQGVPCVVGNGMYVTSMGEEGHAWNYVMIDGEWKWLSDATQKREELFSSIETYHYAYKPHFIELDLLETEDAVFDFKHGCLNQRKVKKANGAVYTQPYSVEGFVVQSFDITEPLPSEITSIYLSSETKTLGESNTIGLEIYAPNLKWVYMKKGATTGLSTYEGLVLRKGYDGPYLVPKSMKTILLPKAKEYPKRTIAHHMEVEEIYFPDVPGSVISSYAVENTPKLKKIYVHKDTKIEEKAFDRVGAAKVERYDKPLI